MGLGARLWLVDVGLVGAPASGAGPGGVAAGAGRRSFVSAAGHADCFVAAMADSQMVFRMDRQADRACRLSTGSHHVLFIDATPSGLDLVGLPAAVGGGGRRNAGAKHPALL